MRGSVDHQHIGPARPRARVANLLGDRQISHPAPPVLDRLRIEVTPVPRCPAGTRDRAQQQFRPPAPQVDPTARAVYGGGEVTRHELLGKWDTVPHWTVTHTSDDVVVANPGKFLNANVSVSLLAAGPGIKPWIDDNQKAGNLLGQLCNRDRLVDGDAFYVHINP
ncbi:hypothetical protein [Actinokineospora inagensis]|uniref:hypothetical protein n=1 Tax=Actinokineospora inagensis TaxID=103730 RepID=UPI0003F87640|nr:hypothetical protein [Actinokineospora inagensis]